VNTLLEYALNQLAAEKRFSECWNAGKTIFRYGEMPFFGVGKTVINPDWIKNYHFYDFGERIRLRRNSEDFLALAGQYRSVKNTGKLVHEILAEVKTANDIEPACNKALSAGKITGKEREIILKKLEESLQNPVISRWFDGGFTVLNERNLIAPGNLLRPDRMMVSGKHAIVVDYKWGEKLPEKYHKQVARYAETLKNCGYEKVEGFLWYINQDEVEQVV
jgi:ATP-dependent helicase/nuclease subunit A